MSTVTQRWRTGRWIALGAVVITALALVSTYLTAPRPGGRMDPVATSPDGAHALVSLLREHGVDVVVAQTVADAERALSRAREEGLIAGDGEGPGPSDRGPTTQGREPSGRCWPRS